MTLISRVNRLPWITQKDPNQVRFERLGKKCESHIERIFWATGYERLSRWGHFTPQVEIGPYRVDFALTNIPGVSLLKMVIELDGHDSHSSPEQCDYDTKRVRYFQRRGWQVVRFTGRQINGNCLACIRETEGLIREWSKWLRC